MVADFFAGETTVFILQFGNFLPNESCCFATSKTYGHGKVWRHRKKIAIQKVGWTLVAISLLASSLWARACACVCFSLVVSIPSKVSYWSLDLNIFQVLIHLLVLLGILINICKSKQAICHNLKERWSKLEFQLTDKGSFVMVQLWD